MSTAGGPYSSGTNTDNLALFQNVQSDGYWSGTEDSLSYAWFFYTAIGGQNYDFKGSAYPAVAVRSGDVAASVPGPGTVALLLLSLGALGLVRRRRPV